MGEARFVVPGARLTRRREGAKKDKTWESVDYRGFYETSRLRVSRIGTA